MREFETGATRNTDEGKYDYEGFLSPVVLERFAEYMHKHRIQADGRLRDSDNWQKGMPFESYIKSAWRHFMDWWLHHRGRPDLTREDLEDAICALIFNAQGYLYELLLDHVTWPNLFDPEPMDIDEDTIKVQLFGLEDSLGEDTSETDLIDFWQNEANSDVSPTVDPQTGDPLAPEFGGIDMRVAPPTIKEEL